MVEPNWTGYIGMVTGIIGAITGIAGAIMGYVSYRKSNSLKSLDLRLELRKAISDARSSLSQLEVLIDFANKSRQAVASATGRYRSGMMEKWKQDVEADKSKLAQMSENAPEARANYENLNPKELESKLVGIHQFQSQINELKEKYDAAVHSDDEERKQIREDMRVRHAPQNHNT